MVEKFNLFRRAWYVWYEKDCSGIAASVSYYSLFGMVPFIFLTFLVNGWLFGREAVELRFIDWGSMLGPGVIALLGEAINNLETKADQFYAPLLGALFFSGMVIVMLNTFSLGLMKTWGIVHRGWRGWLNRCMRSAFLVFVLQVYVLVMLFLKYVAVGLKLFAPALLVSSLAFVVNFVFLALLLSFAYGILTWDAPSWRARWYGALVASGLFLLGRTLVSMYLAITPFPGIYGATGLLIVLLIWVFTTVSIFYYGAAVTKVLHEQYLGTR